MSVTRENGKYPENKRKINIVGKIEKAYGILLPDVGVAGVCLIEWPALPYSRDQSTGCHLEIALRFIFRCHTIT